MFVLPTLRGGGAERVVVTLLRHLSRTRFRLSLVVIDMAEAAYQQEIPEDVELLDLRGRRLLTPFPNSSERCGSDVPDTVFSTLSHLNLALAMLRPILPSGVRFVARETSVISQVIRRYRHPRWWALAYRLFYKRFDLVVCQSRYMRDDLVDHYGYPISRSVVINNPIDVRQICLLAGADEGQQTPADRQYIEFLAVGRLSWEKGFDRLIEAMALCGRRLLRLTILGDGPLRAQLEKLAHDRGVAAQVSFVGFQKNPYPFFRRSDALVVRFPLRRVPQRRIGGFGVRYTCYCNAGSRRNE